MSENQFARRRKCLAKKQDLWCDVDEVFAADDMSNPLIGIVDCVCEVKHRRSVRTKNHKIFKNGIFKTDRAANEIVEGSNAFVGNPKSNDVTFAWAQSPLATKSVVARSAATSFRSSFDLIGGTRTPVGRAIRKKRLDCSEMHGPALGLMDGRAIPIKAQPFQGSENDVDEFWPRAFSIGVFNTKHKLATLLAGKQPVEKSGPGPTYVEVTRRRGSKADSGDWAVHIVDGTVRPSSPRSIN